MSPLPLDTIRVLHVDDEPDFAAMAATFLEKEDDRFIVETASSAAAGLERFGDEIDCIVSDYDMPGKNGIEFLESVRADYPDIPFILYTGKGSEEVASDAISAGVTDYLQKETGSDQYTVLANRIANAVTQTRSQEALAESEQRLSLFIEQSPLGVIEWDENCDIVQANDAATDILGYSEAEIEGESWESIVVETDREQVEEVVEDLLDAEGGYHSVNKNQRKDGSTVTCEWHNRVITDDDGETLSIFSQFQDITSRKEHEHELQVRATAMEAVTDGIAILDEDQEFVFMNEAHAEIYGYDRPEALLGETWGACYDDFDTSWFESEILPELFETGEWRGEIDVTTADGRNIVQDILLNVTADGRVVCVVRDITEQKEHEARLEQSTARLEALFEYSPDMINIHTADGTIVDVNQPFCEAFDQSENSLIGRKVWDIDKQRNPTELLDMLDAMELGDRVEIETEFQRDDGTEFPAEVHITRLPAEDADRFMVISRDITERQERLQEIQALKERLELAVEGANLGVWDWDMRTDEVEFNEQWAAMLGHTVDEIEPHLDAWERRVHPNDLEGVNEAIAAHQNGDTEYYGTEHRLRTADGDWKWIRDVGRIVERNDENEPVRAVGIHLDIDEWKTRERQLEALNRVTQELMSADTREEVVEIGVETTRDLLEIDANSIHLYDDDADELVPAVATDAVYDLVGEPPRFTGDNSIAWRVYQHGETYALNDVYEDTDRYNSGTPIRSEIYLPLGHYGILLAGSPSPGAFDEQDVLMGEILAGGVTTALEQVERTEQLRARERELTSQNDRLEEFASIVSHDLRNPLNVAQGRLELATTECDSEHLDHVERAHERMQTLIENLLTLAQKGEAVTDIEPVALAPLVERCWATVETGEATLVTDLDRTLQAETSRLKQLFENLIRNAIEHGGEDVAVTVGALDDGFYVEDDGPGIPADERDDVFEAGYSTWQGGTGFGLSIVKQIVDAHDWQIRVTEGTEEGARFEIVGVAVAAE